MGQPPCTPADLPHAARLAALLGQGDIDRFLVPIHSDESLARLFHGLPPFSVFAPPCQTCGSARPTRNPRYRGGGPPALERKPFCLAHPGQSTLDPPHHFLQPALPHHFPTLLLLLDLARQSSFSLSR